jgi:hypothetical protein
VRSPASFLSTIGAAVGFLLGLASTGQADVYPQSPFHHSGFGGEYDGYCTTNLNNGQLVNSCHGKLTSGTKVIQTMHLAGPNLRGLVTTSGEVIEVVVVT